MSLRFVPQCPANPTQPSFANLVDEFKIKCVLNKSFDAKQLFRVVRKVLRG